MEETISVPLYQQIKEDIRVAIQSGRYQAGEKIPPEPALSQEYSVSRITIRRAVEELCSEGFLTKMQGRGTFVNTPRIHRKLSATTRLESFTQSCANAGMTAGARVLDRKIVPAHGEEYAFFGIGSEELLLHICRLRTADGMPVFLENTYLPYQQYKDFMKMPLDNVSIFQTIEAYSGMRIADTARRTIEATRASAEQAQQLSVPVGEPLLYLNCCFVDGEKKPVSIGRQYYIGSRYLFEL